jgi:hypothetical protein
MVNERWSLLVYDCQRADSPKGFSRHGPFLVIAIARIEPGEQPQG